MSFGKEITCPEVHSTSTCVTHQQNWNVTVGIQQCSKPHWLSSLILWLNVGYRLSKHNLRLFHKDKKDRKGVNVLIMKVFMGLNRAVSRKRWRSARNIANRKTFVNVCGPQRNSVWVYVRVWGKCDKYLGADMDDDMLPVGKITNMIQALFSAISLFIKELQIYLKYILTSSIFDKIIR